MANPETLNNSNEDLIQESLNELKEQIKPGIVKFENESKDKKYNIYSYTLVQGGTKGGIKNKYINQIGPWVEGTQFTDVNGNEIKKDKFDAGEKVYLRVPKGKEKINSLKEMTSEEVLKLSNKDIEELYNHFTWKKRSPRFSLGTDKKGRFLRIDNKKLYSKEFGSYEPKSELKGYNGPFFAFTQYDSASMPQSISIGIKKGNDIKGYYIGEEIFTGNVWDNNIKILVQEGKTYKGKLKNNPHGGFEPDIIK